MQNNCLKKLTKHLILVLVASPWLYTTCPMSNPFLLPRECTLSQQLTWEKRSIRVSSCRVTFLKVISFHAQLPYLELNQIVRGQAAIPLPLEECSALQYTAQGSVYSERYQLIWRRNVQNIVQRKPAVRRKDWWEARLSLGKKIHLNPFKFVQLLLSQKPLPNLVMYQQLSWRLIWLRKTCV